jgi:hypothetical protein
MDPETIRKKFKNGRCRFKNSRCRYKESQKAVERGDERVVLSYMANANGHGAYFYRRMYINCIRRALECGRLDIATSIQRHRRGGNNLWLGRQDWEMRYPRELRRRLRDRRYLAWVGRGLALRVPHPAAGALPDLLRGYL